MRLYHSQSAWSLRAHWMLEEVGAAPEIVRVALSNEAPARSAPILIDGDFELLGATAIVMYLVEKFPEQRLSPPLGSAERAHYHRWMSYVPEAVDVALDDLARHTRKLPVSKRVTTIAEEAKRKLDGITRTLEGAVDGRPYIIGDSFTAADVMVGSAVVWMDVLGLLSSSPKLAAYHKSLVERPAYERARAVMTSGSGGSSQPWPTAVCLRPGRGTPLFFAARPNQTVGNYAALARHVETERPIYLLQFQYPEERELGRPYNNEEISSWARAYFDAMRGVRPEGPHFFIGLCEGAQIGYEIVRLAEAQGEQVGLFATIDTWPEENTRSPLLYRVYEAERTAREILGLSPGEQVNKVTGRLTRVLDHALGRDRQPRRQQQPPPQQQQSQGLPRRPQPAPNAQAWKDRAFPKEVFTLRPVSTRITVFHAVKQPYWRIRDRELGWGGRTTGGVELYPIDGDHQVVLSEPFVGTLGKQISTCLRRLDAG
jgi:glutathione S-transferase